MSKGAKLIVAIVVAVVVIGGILLLTRKEPDQQPPAGASNGTSQNEQVPAEEPSEAATVITYTDDGFSPAEVTIAAGQSVRFVNDTGAPIAPSSAPHPVHTDNPELNVGDIAAGESMTITLTTTGSWGYHNHYDTSKTGTITVE